MMAVSEGLRFFHDLGHFPSYALTIAVSTLLVRSVLAGPLYIYSEKNQSLITLAYFESKKSVGKPKLANSVETKLHKTLFSRTFQQKCKEYDCHPFRSAIFAMCQLPIWMTVTFGLRNICGLQLTPFIFWPPMIPEFVTEGLILPTTSMGLIALTALTTALNVEIGHLRRVYNLAATNACTADPGSESASHVVVFVPQKLPWQFRFAHCTGLFSTGLISAVSSVAPSALVIYWCLSSSHQLFLHLFHLHPRVRRLLRIPILPIDPIRPYTILWLVARQNYRWLRWLNNRT